MLMEYNEYKTVEMPRPDSSRCVIPFQLSDVLIQKILAKEDNLHITFDEKGAKFFVGEESFDLTVQPMHDEYYVIFEEENHKLTGIGSAKKRLKRQETDQSYKKELASRILKEEKKRQRNPHENPRKSNPHS